VDNDDYRLLLAEIQRGLVFAELATDAAPHVAQRNTAKAGEAYVAALRFRPLVHLDAEASERVGAALERLKNALRELGEAV